MTRLGVALHAFSDRLHVWAHRLMGDPEWRARNGVEAEDFAETTRTMIRASVVLKRGLLSPGEQLDLAGHLRGWHDQRKSGCPAGCPLRS